MSFSVPGEAVAFALTETASNAPVPLAITWSDNVAEDGWFAIDGNGERHWVTEVKDEPFPVDRSVNSAIVYEAPTPAMQATPILGQSPLPSYKAVAQLFVEYINRLYGVLGQRIALNEEMWRQTWTQLAATQNAAATAINAVDSRVNALYDQASTATANLGAAVGAVQNAAGAQAQQISAAQTTAAALQGSVAAAQGDAAAARATATLSNRTTERVAANLLEEEKRAHDRETALQRLVEASDERAANGLQALTEQVSTLSKALEQRFTASGTTMAEVREQQRRLVTSQEEDRKFVRQMLARDADDRKERAEERKMMQDVLVQLAKQSQQMIQAVQQLQATPAAHPPPQISVLGVTPAASATAATTQASATRGRGRGRGAAAPTTANPPTSNEAPAEDPPASTPEADNNEDGSGSEDSSSESVSDESSETTDVPRKAAGTVHFADSSMPKTFSVTDPTTWRSMISLNGDTSLVMMLLLAKTVPSQPTPTSPHYELFCTRRNALEESLNLFYNKTSLLDADGEPNEYYRHFKDLVANLADVSAQQHHLSQRGLAIKVEQTFPKETLALLRYREETKHVAYVEDAPRRKQGKGADRRRGKQGKDDESRWTKERLGPDQVGPMQRGNRKSKIKGLVNSGPSSRTSSVTSTTSRTKNPYGGRRGAA